MEQESHQYKNNIIFYTYKHLF